MRFRSSSIGIWAASVLAVSAMLIGVSTTVRASTGLTIQPIKVSQTMKPGDAISGTIRLSNASDEDVVVDLSVQDFIPVAGAETFQFVNRAPGVTTVRDWITFNGGKHTFTFKRGEIKEIPYEIKAPPHAEPGSHFGVLLFKAVRASEATSQLKVGTQVGVLVFVTIPGKFEQKGVIRNFATPSFHQTAPIIFNMQFENQGTVHFEPKGTIEISNMFGAKVGSIPIEGYAVLPTGVKNMTFTWNVAGFLLGKYQALASVYDVSGNLVATSSASFWVVPIWYIVGFLVVFIALFFIIKFIKSRLKFTVSFKK